MNATENTAENTNEQTQTGWEPTEADHQVIAKLNSSAQHPVRRGQEFYTVKALDPAYRTAEDVRALPVLAHYFGGSCDWLVLGMDEEGVAYGFACLGDPMDAEYGAFSLPEIESINRGLLIFERDEHWEQTTIAELKEEQRWAEILRWA